MLKLASLPFGTQAKRVVASILAILILLSASIGGAIVVSATDDYTVVTENKGSSDYTLDNTNLIYGINPQENSAVSRFTDGNKDCMPASMTKLSFSLGDGITVNKVRVISQNGYGGVASRLGTYDIYIADTYEDLYKPENKVATFNSTDSSTSYLAAIDTFEFASSYAKTGKFIGFHVTKTDNGGLNKIHINEIEVFGTAPAPSDLTINTTYGSTSDAIDTTNLIYGVYPEENSGVDRFTDGINAGKETGIGKWSFELSEKYTINKIKVTSQNGYAGKSTRLACYEIYVADSFDDLYNAENKVATFNSDSTDTTYRTEIDTFEFSSTVAKEGKFVGFKIIKGSNGGTENKFYPNEFEVFGEKVVIPDLIINTTYGSTSDAIDTTNLIYGVYPEENSGVDRFTDGINAGKETGIGKWSFELSEKYTINKIKVTSQNGYAGKSTRLACYEIYVADSFDDLYNAENKVATFNSDSTDTTYRTEIDTFEFSSTVAKEGKFVGFKIIKGSNGGTENKFYPNEFEVFGEKVVIPDWTVNTTTGSTSDTIDSSDNLIYQKTPEEFSAVTELTDGLAAQRTLRDAQKLSFSLGNGAKIEEIVVRSQNQTASASRLGKYEIYAANSLEELYNAENKIAYIDPEVPTAGWRTYIDTFVFSESYAKTAKYVGFKILERNVTNATGEAYINEIQVKGTPVSAPPTPPASTVIDTEYGTLTITKGTTDDAIDSSDSIIKGKTATQSYGSAFAHVTDGTNKLVGKGSNGWPYKFTYKLDGIYEIEQVQVISGTNTQRIGEFEIYVSNSAENLFDSKNKKANVKGESVAWVDGGKGTVIDKVDFKADYAEGVYFGISLVEAYPGADMTVNQAAYISEVLVKGTFVSEAPVPTPPAPTVIPTEYGSLTTTKGTTDDAIDSSDSIIKGKTATQSYGNAFAHFTDGTNKLIGKGSSGWPYKFTYKLDGIYEIEQVQVISGTNIQRIGEFEIYVSDSAEKLFDSKNKKATVKGESVAWVDGGKGTVIDTVNFKDDYAEGMYFGISLIEAYPGADMKKDQAAYISEVLVKGTFKGVPNLTILSTTHNTADWNTDTTNLIYGITPQENDTVTKFTDGDKVCTPTGMTRISFPLLSSSTVKKVRVISQNGYGKVATRLAAYDIYIADSYEDLYKPENKVASFSTDSTASNYITAIDTFEFSDTYAKKGKYIGFDITKTNYGAEADKIYVNEIEVFGTSEGGTGSATTVLGKRPTLENVNENFSYKTEALTISGGRNHYDNLTLYGQAHTNQSASIDYKFSSSVTPVVWAKAIFANETKGSVTGYYVTIEGGTSAKLYKRTSDGKDHYIGPCGNADYRDQDSSIIRNVRLQVVTEKVGNATKITVMAYKFGGKGDEGNCYLMTKRSFYDSTEELQTPGYAGFAIKGAGKTANVVSFAYSSSDGTADNLSYIENPVTSSSSGIAGQKVIIDPAKTYTLTARVSLDNTLLAVYYLDANGKMERGFSSVGDISNVDGYRTVTYEFCLNDIIKENELAAPYADVHGYSGMAEVFVGFTTDKSKVLSYSNLSLIEKESGEEKLTNNQFKMGLLSWAETIETGKWAFKVGDYGSNASARGIIVLKNNVSKSAYDAIFKMGANESTGIDYSKYSDFMLHINGNGSDFGKVGQMVQLEVGQTYIYEVDFGFDPRNGVEPIIFYHTDEDKKISLGTRTEPVSKLTRNGCRVTYEFTVPDKAYVNPETNKATVFVGVSTGEAGAKCYFYNFDLYKQSDASKTNLFLNPDFKLGFKNWIVNHNYQWNFLSPVGTKTFTQPGTGVELLPYDASKFTLDDGTLVVAEIPDVDYSNYKGKFMIYVPETVTSTYGKLGQVLYFEKGVKYNFTMLFKYIRQNSTKPVVLYYKDDPYATNEYIISKGYTNAKGEADRVKYLTAIRDTVSFDLIMDDANCTQTVEFKVPSDAWKNSEGKSPMFVGISSGEKGTRCYYADFCVSKEGSKENMLLNADFKQGFYNWIITYGYLIDPISEEGVYWTNGYTIAQILPFDETIFINDTNDGLWNDGDWYSVFGEDDALEGALNGGSSSNTQTVIVPGKINIPATIALYGGIVVVLAAGAVVTIILIKKKKQQA